MVLSCYFLHSYILNNNILKFIIIYMSIISKNISIIFSIKKILIIYYISNLNNNYNKIIKLYLKHNNCDLYIIKFCKSILKNGFKLI